MSKQICFFATQKDVDCLIDYIYDFDAIVINYSGHSLTKDMLSAVNYNDLQERERCNNFLITKPEFSIAYRRTSEKSEIDQYVSEVIEFSVCTPIPMRVIDTSSVDREFQKGEFVVIDDCEKYNQLIKQLMQNPPYVENPNYIAGGFEHGRLWYTPIFLDSTGKENKKTEALDALFNNVKKHIIKNFIPSKDKFAYIAPDAYEKYLSGEFVPCSGKNRIVF